MYARVAQLDNAYDSYAELTEFNIFLNFSSSKNREIVGSTPTSGGFFFAQVLCEGVRSVLHNFF